MTGTAIPGFELGELLGRGGCASVYRARQLSVDRDVALKIDNRHVSEERDRRRFLREVTAVGRLSGHPHVVEIYDAGVLADDRPYIAMQLCPNGSLHEHVRDTGPLTFAELQRVGVQLADALATAHGAGIVHRDVKPGNVLVNGYGVVVLSDFGLASILDADSRQSATRGVFTPAYAAPEALGLDDPTPAMDLWSFACTVFELVTGRLPAFRGRGEPIGPDEVVAAAVAEPFEPVALPPDLVAWLVRGLAFDPSGRWASAAEMRDELAALDLTVVPELPDRSVVRRRPVIERLPESFPSPSGSFGRTAASLPTQASPQARPDPAGSPAAPAGPASTSAGDGPDAGPPNSPGRRALRVGTGGPRSSPKRSWGVMGAAVALAVVVGGTWAASGWFGPRSASASGPSASGPAGSVTPSGSATVVPRATPQVAPSGPAAPVAASADPAGTWVLDGGKLDAALDRVAAVAGYEPRLTNLVAVRVNGYTRLTVETQDPKDREAVLQYGVDGAGIVTGPQQVTSLALLDVGASRITAAMVDRKTFGRSALPDARAFARGQRAAIARVGIREAEIMYWTFNAYGGTPRMMLGVESPYGKAIVEIDRNGRVVQVMA